jgi:hypothetical protein
VDGGKRLVDNFLGEDVGEGQVAALEELTSQEARLPAERFAVRIAHGRSLLAGDGAVAKYHLVERDLFAYVVFIFPLAEDLGAIRVSVLRAGDVGLGTHVDRTAAD